MPKQSLCVVFLAAAFAASSVVAAPSSKQSSTIKPFGPALKSRVAFTVQNPPLQVEIPEQATESFAPSIPANADSAIKKHISSAIAYLNKSYSISTSDIRVTDAYTDQSSGITHVYLVQNINGIDAVNSVANVNVNSKGDIISASHSFAPVSSVERALHTITTNKNTNDTESVKEALFSLAKYIKKPIDSSDKTRVHVSTSHDDSFANGGNPNGAKFEFSGLPSNLSINGKASAKKTFHHQADGSLVSTWTINIEQENHWWDANINAETGAIESLVDWYSSSESYYVYPKNVLSPEDGDRTLVVDPADKKASPKGWTTDGYTYGNNVWAQSNPSGRDTWKDNHRPKASDDNVFKYSLDLEKEPDNYIDAAITQLFYTNNILHDLSYIYGFDEAAGNFQDENFSGKGIGGDGVIANAQDGSGTDNANFATPPDGQRPRMRMYIWTATSPKRDGDFEQDIVAHEFMHGVSNRLTGGPSNTNCLGYGESGGMGEGWGDAVSSIIRLSENDTRDTDFELGKYVYTKGIRNYPYSTNKNTNPSTYKFLDRWDYREVHAIGEVWAEILYEVMWNLVDKHGFGDLFSHDLSKGNVLMLQLLLDGMKLQPCNPSFIDARDAIIQADKNLTGGKNKCEIWKGFSKRGLGPKASAGIFSKHIEDFNVPKDC